LILLDGMVLVDWFLMYTGDILAHCGMFSFVIHLIPLERFFHLLEDT
jgi:hypothetical protein